VHQAGGLIEEGRMVSHLLLKGFGLTPPVHERFV